MADFTFDIKEFVCALSDRNEKGWRKEVNLISWNGAKPKYDIREWNEDYSKMSKGITLTDEEMRILASELQAQGFC